jgi:hypothetical protein
MGTFAYNGSPITNVVVVSGVQPFPDNISDSQSHAQPSNKGPFKLNGPYLLN